MISYHRRKCVLDFLDVSSTRGRWVCQVRMCMLELSQVSARCTSQMLAMCTSQVLARCTSQVLARCTFQVTRSHQVIARCRNKMTRCCQVKLKQGSSWRRGRTPWHQVGEDEREKSLWRHWWGGEDHLWTQLVGQMVAKVLSH